MSTTVSKEEMENMPMDKALNLIVEALENATPEDKAAMQAELSKRPQSKT